MFKFKEFTNLNDVLILETNDDKVKLHLSHLEDLAIEQGKQGFNNFEDHVINLINFLTGLSSKTKLNAKIDGCVHPESVLLTQEENNKSIYDIIMTDNKLSVLTYNEETQMDEFCEVYNKKINTSEKPWIEILLENGENIKVTEDHKILTTNRGWIMAKELNLNDDIKEYKKIE